MGRATEFSTRQLVLISAALRHVRDAAYLLDASHPGQSIDQAFHLAGFGPECARKALLGDRVFDKVLGHRFDAGVELVLDAALALDPQARRYSPRGWAARYPALPTWSEQSRYYATGTKTDASARPVVEQAARAVHDTVVALFADGRIPSGFSW